MANHLPIDHFKQLSLTHGGSQPKEIKTRLAEQILKNSERVEDTNQSIPIYSPSKKEVNVVSAGINRIEINKRGEYSLKPLKTILVVGETGTGKTTCINSIFNYVYDVEMADDFRFKIVTQDDEGKESCHSHTKTVNTYYLYGTNLTFDLVIIDTPGYGDTQGLKEDKKTTEHIKKLFEGRGKNGVQALDAICLVVKSNETRLTPSQKYNFDAVLQLFGKDMKNNIFVIATFSDGGEPAVVKTLEGAEIHYKELFKLNNSAFFQGPTSNEVEEKLRGLYWNIGCTQIKSFFTKLGGMTSVSLQLSARVLRRREELENLVVCMQQEINAGLHHLEKMRQEALVLDKYKDQIKRNEEFTFTVDEPHTVKKDISGQGIHVTNCLQCNFTCHDNCAFANDAEKRGCVAIDGNGYCEVCPKNCFWDQHYNRGYIFITEIKKVTKTHEDLKRKYGDAKKGHMNAESMMNNLGEQFGRSQLKVMDAINKIRSYLDELQKIAFRPTFMTNIDYLDTLIKSEELEARPGWQARVDHLLEQRKLAVHINEANNPSYDPFAKYRKEKGGWAKYIMSTFSRKFLM